MRNDSEEQLAFEQIQKVEEALHARLDLARKQAAQQISLAQGKADTLVQEKESRLAELQCSMELDAIYEAPEKEIYPDHADMSCPSDLVNTLAGELFERVLGQAHKAK